MMCLWFMVYGLWSMVYGLWCMDFSKSMQLFPLEKIAGGALKWCPQVYHMFWFDLCFVFCWLLTFCCLLLLCGCCFTCY